MPDPTPETLAELEALERDATAFPWRAVEWGYSGSGMPEVWAPHSAQPGVKSYRVADCHHAGESRPSEFADAKLIAALRNAVPELLRLARRGLLVEEMARVLAYYADPENWEPAPGGSEIIHGTLRRGDRELADGGCTKAGKRAREALAPIVGISINITVDSPEELRGVLEVISGGPRVPKSPAPQAPDVVRETGEVLLTTYEAAPARRASPPVTAEQRKALGRYPFCRQCGQLENVCGHDDAGTVGPFCKFCGVDRMGPGGHEAGCEHHPDNRKPAWKGRRGAGRVEGDPE